MVHVGWLTQYRGLKVLFFGNLSMAAVGANDCGQGRPASEYDGLRRGCQIAPSPTFVIRFFVLFRFKCVLLIPE